MGTTSAVPRGIKIERGVASSQVSNAFLFFVFFSEVSDTFSVSRSVFKLPHNFRALTCPICCCSTLPSRCVEQHRMNSRQLTYNAHDAVPLDNLQSSFYDFPEILDGSKVTQAPHTSPSYVQRQYRDAPDSGASKDGGSPQLPYHIPEQAQRGHPSPSPQQHRPYPTGAYPPFQHDHERSYPTHQDFSHQPPRASVRSAPMPVGPWPIDPFSDNASTQFTALPGGISPTHGHLYSFCPQPPNHPPPTHHSAPTDAPLEQSQPTTAPGPSTPHEQHEDRAITVQGQRSHSWVSVGSQDPVTGAFYGTSDHPRIRTAQACEKCRARKAKVSIVPPSFPLSPPVPLLTNGRLCCHSVLRRASDMPAMSRARAGMQIRRRAPYARTQQAEATTLNARWIPAVCRRGGTEAP
jgi:hypothetical protein